MMPLRFYQEDFAMKGGDPVAGKKTVGLVTAVCFILNGLLSFPVFAATGTESAAGTTGTAVNAVDKSAGTTEKTPGTAADNNTGRTTIAAIGASGTAIRTTAAAIGASGPTTEITAASICTTASAIKITGITTGTTGTAINASGSAVLAVPKVNNLAKNNENLWYLPQISMKKEHQKLLWDYCKKRGIDYIDMLALISLESNFYEKCSSGRYKGYFQISSRHSKNLAATLKTANKPLDGAININWGTAMYGWILADKRVKGLQGKKLRDAALSIYHRGSGGYDRYGIDKSFLAKYYKKRDKIVALFKK